jgi:ribonuclease I
MNPYLFGKYLLFVLVPIFAIFKSPELGYSPSKCEVSSYYFTFLRQDGVFKVHGLWPESCEECQSCGYPSCCNRILEYVYPNDPSDFIKNNWFKSLNHNECNGDTNIILFEHEYYKHGSCMDVSNTTQYLNDVILLFDNYYSKYVAQHCEGHEQLWLYLDENKQYVKTLCK